ncbi:MAG: hypothetical protein IT480_12755 [Gammaproteobacteria bacterium]|nr:hypothetical protein [Gammaproteobacteria bacterium]
MDFIHRLEHGAQDDLRYRIEVRGDLGVEDRDPALLRLVLDRLGDVPPPRKAGGVIDQQVRPAALGVLDGAQQIEKARTILGSPRLDDVLKPAGDPQRARFGERFELARLGGDRHVAAILAGSQVQGGAIGVAGR